jgi:hypothetical protein
VSLSLQTNCSTLIIMRPPRGRRRHRVLHGWVPLDSGLYKCGDLQDILHLTSIGSLVCY